MAKKLTQADIIERIREVHCDKYDLSKIVYVNRRTKIELVCKEHGSWFTTTEQLFRGQGCFTCGKKQSGISKRASFIDFVKKANEIHEYKYTYFKDSFKKLSSKTKIECPEHGIFFQLADEHARSGQGCPQCGLLKIGDLKRLPLDDFILRSNEKHSDKYDYSKVDYRRNNIKVIIICPEHGEFEQEPQNHLNGSGCLTCSIIETHEQQKKSKEGFITDSLKVHNNLYNYSLIDFADMKTPVEIICSKHGSFFQVPAYHQGGSGCPNCNISKGEDLVKRILTNRQIEFHQQFTFRKLRDKRMLKCDFYLPNFNMVIEFNGRQHYEPVNQFGGGKRLE
ncbi:hypothetical protein [Lutimonas vermicola]|uniref:Uncharacterized protein n=1 Tax=Lutimonas vermicola TaxID=414288 RepID=A0ABU9L691_9FLAO